MIVCLVISSTYSDATTVGSDLYAVIVMLSAYGGDKSNLTIEERNRIGKRQTELVLKHLGAKLDENGFLQLGTSMTNGMNPMQISSELHGASYFYTVFATAVMNQYLDNEFMIDEYKILNNKELHQLRFYFDKQNIEYVRKNYNGATDEEKLKAYFSDIGELYNKRYDNAEYHNEGLNYDWFGLSGPNKGYNSKLMLDNKISEFIVDKTGNFVSQWNIYDYDKNGNVISNINYYIDKYRNDWEGWCQIVNTESTNYAYSYSDVGFLSDQKQEKSNGSVSSHTALDAAQSKLNSDLVKKAESLCS